MLKKRFRFKISRFLLAIAPVMVFNVSSNLAVGEPSLPNKFTKNK